jgi:metalloendopeptidase OMA1, mitochondrial
MFLRSDASLCLVLVLLCLVVACTTVPYTQRSQFVMLDESQEMQMGVAAFHEALKKERVVRAPEFVGVVEKVGRRIARVADKPDYQWEFIVIDDPKTVNAFALPGGKVAVYTGLFPVARDEAGLAAVIGHEVAHALARHGAERMSQGMLLEIAAVGVSAAIGDTSPATQRGIMQAFGLGAEVGIILPFGRAQESEADRIGLILMAKAGYDPEAALLLWRRMEEQGTGAPPEFLSTHPSYDTRQQKIALWIAEARTYYRPDPNLTVAPLPSIDRLHSKEPAADSRVREAR